MMREEVEREKLKGRAELRAWRYERKLWEREREELARWCWEDMRRRVRGEEVVGEWEGERRDFCKEKGWVLEEIERLREGGDLRGEEIVGRERRWQEREKWERIRESRFNG